MSLKRTALITGASSGIGRAFARWFARSGYDLVITGRRKDKLILLADELKVKSGISVEVIIAELSDEKDVHALLKIIESRDNIYVLINNAGFGSGMEFREWEISHQMQMMQVHIITAVRLVHAVLPQMINRREGTVINVSSLAAFMPGPGNSIYSASKLFLKNFTESLHMEASRYGVRFQCLCPGLTRTDFHDRLIKGLVLRKNGFIRWMEADTVVERCLKSIEKGKIVYIPGFINRMMVKTLPVIPSRVYYKLMIRASKKYRKQE